MNSNRCTWSFISAGNEDPGTEIKLRNSRSKRYSLSLPVPLKLVQVPLRREVSKLCLGGIIRAAHKVQEVPFTEPIRLARCQIQDYCGWEFGSVWQFVERQFTGMSECSLNRSWMRRRSSDADTLTSTVAGYDGDTPL
jgi:hypothetical protein